MVISLEIKDDEFTEDILKYVSAIYFLVGLYSLYDAIKRFITNLSNPKVKTFDQVLVVSLSYSIVVLLISILIILGGEKD